MAKKSRSASATKKNSRRAAARRGGALAPGARARRKVADVVKQVKEPLSLLGTLQKEGAANAAVLMSLAGAVASGATRNLRLETLKPQLRELVGTMGFAMRADLDKLEARVEELESKLSEKEFAEMRGTDDE